MGFRPVGAEYVRVDMAERLIKQAHDARKQGTVFAIDVALATSLGLSTEVHEALLQVAGFDKTDAVPAAVKAATKGDEKPEEKATAKETPAADDTPPVVETTEVKSEETTAVPTSTEITVDVVAEPIPAIHWQWKGMGKRQAKRASGQHKKSSGKQSHGKGQSQGGAKKPEPVLATASGAFAELAALRESMKK
jgi:ATP-dependent RNA helicase SUPV3L1/SUV3